MSTTIVLTCSSSAMIQHEQNPARRRSGARSRKTQRDVGLRQLAGQHVARPRIGEAPRFERGDFVQIALIRQASTTMSEAAFAAGHTGPERSASGASTSELRIGPLT